MVVLTTPLPRYLRAGTVLSARSADNALFGFVKVPDVADSVLHRNKVSVERRSQQSFASGAVVIFALGNDGPVCPEHLYIEDWSTKISAVVDQAGMPVRIVVSQGLWQRCLPVLSADEAARHHGNGHRARPPYRALMGAERPF